MDGNRKVNRGKEGEVPQGFVPHGDAYKGITERIRRKNSENGNLQARRCTMFVL